ncbi:diacylglycerol-binding protein [Mycobacterium gordonae]|uniref:Uncharacterized protein n=1 Tax=Mycobacterium gordonae TaxID=1778 RepID=A0A1X1W0A1_MYCGO|nr:hypothetical protein [Mycobacterium gordonae]PJE15865.1 MAG: hypothetical protein CK429_09390 [Mycobacterium sp.]MBX9982688.1 hypothetical protein [Mycobacterium gordonae]MCQ4362804.1 hypothetical protein [Mycobacterium gordonae]MCV7010153.1 hypothetical protein [Mycobacterium gordonae]ODR22814.1 hypothetical protein BHQ23_07095 [Mycobacterium gordonae]
MQLRIPGIALLFLIGAVAGLVGDHCHVVTGTTVYLPASHQVPFVWTSPIWFPALVGVATVLLAELRLHLGAARPTVTVRQGLGGVAAVVGTYAITALAHTAPAFVSTVLIGTLATITWSVLGDRSAIVCAVAIAIVGPAAEVFLVVIDVFRYTHGSDGLFGVAPWLIPLYFAFGVVAALLGEIVTKRR